jgi:hypothetical protein
MTKRPFSIKGYRTKDLLELVHTNVYGPMNVLAQGGECSLEDFMDHLSEEWIISQLTTLEKWCNRMKE